MVIEIVSIKANKGRLVCDGGEVGTTVISYTIVAIVITDKTKIEMSIDTEYPIETFVAAKDLIGQLMGI